MRMRFVIIRLVISDLDLLKNFIDDNEIENDKTFYQQFQNVSNSTDDIWKEEFDKSMGDIEKTDLSNFCETSEEGEIDDFKDTEKRIEKFKETIFPTTVDDNDNENYNILCDKV